LKRVLVVCAITAGCFGALVAVLAAVSVHRLHSPPGTVEGQIRDPGGGDVSGCFVYPHGTSMITNAPGVVTTSGSTGRFELTVAPGGYVLKVSCRGNRVGRVHASVHSRQVTTTAVTLR
jgi:hypothetical protein